MVFKTQIFFGLMIALVYPSSAEELTRYWILEAATPLRSQPKAQSEVKTYLRTGTEFYSSKNPADWKGISFRYGKSAFGGWIPATMVSETEVDSKSLLKQLRRAKSRADSILWFERIVSLQPESTSYLKALQMAYAASGDTTKAAYYDRELRGTNPIYLARYDGEDVLVFGAIDSTGGFRDLLWYEEQQDSDDTKFSVANDASRAIKKRALALRDKFASMAWYMCGNRIAPGNRLQMVMAPKVVPDTKKTGSFPRDADGRATFGISLGSSSGFYDESGASVVFATRPIFHVPVSGVKGPPATWDSLAFYQEDLIGQRFDSSGVSEVEYTALPEYGHVDIRMRGFSKNAGQAVEQRGIYNSLRKRVWPPEGQTTFEAEEGWGRNRLRPRWFRFGSDASFPAFIILPFSTHYQPPGFEEGESGTSGYQLLRLDKRGLKAFTFQTAYGGC